MVRRIILTLMAEEAVSNSDPTIERVVTLLHQKRSCRQNFANVAPVQVSWISRRVLIIPLAEKASGPRYWLGFRGGLWRDALDVIRPSDDLAAIRRVLEAHQGR